MLRNQVFVMNKEILDNNMPSILSILILTPPTTPLLPIPQDMPARIFFFSFFLGIPNVRSKETHENQLQMNETSIMSTAFILDNSEI